MQGNTYGHDPAFENNPYLTNYGNVMPPGGGNGGGGGNNGGDCSPCYDSNPPGWCNNPNNACYNCCNNIPIDLGPVGLILSMAFGIFLLKLKQNEKSIYYYGSSRFNCLSTKSKRS